MSKNLPDVDENRFPEILERLPSLTSYDAGWRNINLEFNQLPPGETPEFCLAHDVLAINIGQGFQGEHVLAGTRQEQLFFRGAVALCPQRCPHSFRWDRDIEALSLNLKPELLALNAIELLGTDCIELIPYFALEDEFIHQIGLALQAELQLNSGSCLYAETLANALAVHLLRHYTTPKRRVKTPYIGGLPQCKLRLVLDYINDYLDRELSLNELAAIAQLSPYYFSRAFKQSTGFSPHQYLIRQRVERAKQLLQAGKLSIGEVAIVCGFAHQSHLHRHFKRLLGVTPKAFINS